MNGTSYQDTDLSENTLYSYYVKAFRGSIESDASNRVDINTPPCVITGWRGEYFNNETLSGDPVLVRDDAAIDFDWEAGAPGPGVNHDHFSARWTRAVHFDAGMYRFSVFRDDGARLWIDDVLVLDEWHEGREWHTVDHALSAGDHTIRLQMYEITGWATAKLSWAGEPVDTTPPTGCITYPPSQAQIKSIQINITAVAEDNPGGSGLAFVSFLTDYSGQWEGIGVDDDGSDGWSYIWDVSALADKTFSLYIFVYDRAGNWCGAGAWSIVLDRSYPPYPIWLACVVG